MNLRTLSMRTLLTRYVLPQIVGLVVNSLYFLVDGIYIGRRLGPAGLAAAGVAVPLVEVTIALAMMLSVGSAVLVSAAAGRGDGPEARRIFNLSVRFTLGVSLVLMVLGGLFATPLARLLGADDAILADTATYLRVFLLFSPFFIFSYALSTFVRNDGRPSLAMWALTLGSVMNILLDWVFMYPLNMGIGGAALATGLGPVFSVVLMLPWFFGKRGNLYFERVRFAWRDIGRILTGGAPALVSESTIGLVTLLYNLAIVRQGLGEEGLASYVVIGYAALIGSAVFLGTAQGLQPAVSYFHGAGLPGRIRGLMRAGGLLNLILGVAIYGVILLLGPAFYAIFMPGDPALLAATEQAGRLYFLFLPFAALNILLAGLMQAMQQVKRSLVVSLCRSTLPLALFLLLLPAVWPQNGLWLAVTFTEGFTLLLAAALWKSMRLPEDALSPLPEKAA